MTNIHRELELVNHPKIDWADFEQNPEIARLHDAHKNVLSAIVILMYQNKENFGILPIIVPEVLMAFNFCRRLTVNLIKGAVEDLIKKKLIVSIDEGDEQFFTVPLFFHEVV